MERKAAKNSAEIKARCQSLHEFVKEAWPLLEPEQPFSDNWHIRLICDHLEAVTAGQITRLLINVWPGSMKSLIVSVFWPAWEWGPKGRRSLRYLSTAFNETPTTRDSRKTRDLILSGWYQTLWSDVKLVRWGETSFANKDTGSREGIPFGSLTSQRGDRLIIDDPHSTETAESDAERLRTTRKFREGAVNRLNDQRRSAIVVIMQRLHQDDLSGVIMRHYPEFVHVVLPMEFEPARAYRSRWGSDPRTTEGGLADPKRFPPSTIAELKQSGDYFWAGQYQQRPAPRGGGLFHIPENWSVPAAEGGMVVEACPHGSVTVGGWDLAGTKRKTSPYSVRVKITEAAGAYYIRHVARRRTRPEELDEMLVEIATDDGLTTVQSIPQDPGQAGKHQVNAFAKLLVGFEFRFSTETGDKEFRARPFAAQWNAGRVFLVRGDWNDDFVDELRNFPAGSFKDQVDATSRAFAELIKTAPPQSNPGPIVVDPEEEAALRARAPHTRELVIDDPWSGTLG